MNVKALSDIRRKLRILEYGKQIGDFAVTDHSISLLIDHPKLYEERRHAGLFTGRLKLAV